VKWFTAIMDISGYVTMNVHFLLKNVITMKMNPLVICPVKNHTPELENKN
jgi:hypothetical protein